MIGRRKFQAKMTNIYWFQLLKCYDSKTKESFSILKLNDESIHLQIL